MEIKIKSYSSQSSLISSIIFFILGAILFTSPDKVINTVFNVIGIIIAIVSGISLLIFFFQARKGNTGKGNLIFGIITALLAITFIFFNDIIEQFIRFLIGAWILFTGILRLISVLAMNKKSSKFLQLLIVSLLLIAVGVYTILYGGIFLQTMGIIMMIYAGIEIIGFILYSKDKTEPEEPGTTTLIVPESTNAVTEEKNDIVVKDVKEKKKRKKNKKAKDVEEIEEEK